MDEIAEEHRKYMNKEFRIKTSDTKTAKISNFEGYSPAAERKIHTSSEAHHGDRIYGSPPSALTSTKSQANKSNKFSIIPSLATSNVNKSNSVENILGV